jgi:hypothetical protein
MARKNDGKTEQPENESISTLMGWARRSNAGGALKLSLHAEAVTKRRPYTTSDGIENQPLVISMSALRRVLDGEPAVATESQFQDA